MAHGIPRLPTLAETAAVLAQIGQTRARVAAMAIRPPDNVDARNVDLVREAAREAEAARRGGVDVKV